MKWLYNFFLLLTIKMLIFSAQETTILENIPSLAQLLELFEFEIDDKKKGS